MEKLRRCINIVASVFAHTSNILFSHKDLLPVVGADVVVKYGLSNFTVYSSDTFKGFSEASS